MHIQGLIRFQILLGAILSGFELVVGQRGDVLLFGRRHACHIGRMQRVNDVATGVVVVLEDIVFILLRVVRLVEIGRVVMETGENIVVEVRRETARVAAQALGADEELRPFREIDAVEHEIARGVELADGRKAQGWRDERNHRPARGPEGPFDNAAERLRVLFAEAGHFRVTGQDVGQFVIGPAVGQHHGIHVGDALGQGNLFVEQALCLFHERRKLAAQVPPRHQVVALAAVGRVAVVGYGNGPVAFREVIGRLPYDLVVIIQVFNIIKVVLKVLIGIILKILYLFIRPFAKSHHVLNTGIIYVNRQHDV